MHSEMYPHKHRRFTSVSNKILKIVTQQTHDVVSTSIRRLYDVATSYRRLIDVETTSCVYWVIGLIVVLAIKVEVILSVGSLQVCAGLKTG